MTPAWAKFVAHALDACRAGTLAGAALAQLFAQQDSQPVPFNHKKHIALGLKCQNCHPNAEPGVEMTFPAAAKCMSCHATIDTPAIQKLRDFSNSQQPISWVRIYTLPDFVFWKHRSHLKAGVKCETCHGDIAQMNVVTKATNVTKMAGCMDCHRQKNVSIECSFCHDLN